MGRGTRGRRGGTAGDGDDGRRMRVGRVGGVRFLDTEAIVMCVGAQRVLSRWSVVVRRVADKRGSTGRRAYPILISQAGVEGTSPCLGRVVR